MHSVAFVAVAARALVEPCAVVGPVLVDKIRHPTLHGNQAEETIPYRGNGKMLRPYQPLAKAGVRV